MENIIDKSAWICIKDKRILSTRSKGKDTYYIPGGKRELGETHEQALVREIQEELDVTLLPDTIRSLGVFKAQAHGKLEGVVVRMTCFTGEFQGQLKPSSEITEFVWLQHRDKVRSSPVDQIIFDWLNEQGLLE